MRKNLRKVAPWLMLLTFTALTFFVRLMVLNRYETPPSGDLAGHLLVLESYTSEDPIHPDWKYHSPPLFYFLIVKPFTTIFPLFLGLKIYSALIPSMVAIPFFLLCRKITGNDVSSLIATVLFTFSEPYNEIIGWGGITNMMGILFALFFFYFTFKMFEQKRVHYAIMSSLFFSMTVGTHHFTAVYCGLVIVVMLLIMMIQRRFTAMRWLLLMLLTTLALSIPYAYVYLYLLMNRAGVLEIGSLQSLSDPRNWGRLYYDFWTYISREPWTSIIYAVIIFPSAYYLKKYDKREPKIFVVCLFAALAILIFFTNIELICRVVYFLPIPLFLTIAIFIKSSLERMRNKRAHLLFMFLLSIIVGSLMYASYVRLNVAVDWYHVLDNEALEAIDWISKNTLGNTTIFVNRDVLDVWIEALAHRATLAPRPWAFHITKQEHYRISDANIISLGNHVLENGKVAVSDHFPEGYETPGIYIRTSMSYAPLLFIYDGAQYMELTSMNNRTSYMPNLLGSPQKSVYEASSSGKEAFIVYRYSYEKFYTALRNVSLTTHSTITISYELKSPSYLINELMLKISAHWRSKVIRATIDGNQMRLSLLTSDGFSSIPANLVISITKADGLSFIYFNMTDPMLQLPTFTLLFKPSNTRVSVTLNICIEGIKAGQEARLFSSYELMEKYNVGYVVVDKTKSYSDFVRFEKNPAHFLKVYENNRVAIFKVVGGG
jgi:hypothetical protein